MKNKKRIERKMKGKTAVLSAVFMMIIMTMTVLSGCQSPTREEAVPEAVSVEETGFQAKAVSRTEEMQPAQSAQQAETGKNGAQEPPDADEIWSGQENEDREEPPADWELILSSEDWGLSFGEPGMQPVGNALPEDLSWYDAYYVGADNEKVIYLTFDCGYENGNTEMILDALKKHNVRATFFVVGHFLETAPDMVERMVDDGHAVGNHTYHHLDMAAVSEEETFQKEMDDVADLFYDITGEKLAPYYRPPQGKCNVENLKMAQKAGYYTIFWSLAYVDWNQEDQPSREEAFDKLTTRIHPGAVVLLHNTSSINGEILDELLTKWEEMGYTFQPLSELVEE